MKRNQKASEVHSPMRAVTIDEKNRQLVEQTRELEELNQSLDEKVAERTAELRQNNEKLNNNKDEQGNIIGVLGVFGDITDRKKAQEQTQAEDSKLRGVLDSMIDGVTITDMSGKITSINSATTEQVGYSEQEVIGKTLGEVFIAEQDMPKFRQAVKTLATGQAIRDQEFLCRHKNGTTFPMGLNLSVLKDDQGKPTAIIADHRDITERKKAEKKLRATNQQLITSEQQLTAANQQLQASVAEREETEESLRQAKEQAEHAEAKVRQINKQLEASIKQVNLMAEQAMSADMTKSEFLANMSHEIRTPMTGFWVMQICLRM